MEDSLSLDLGQELVGNDFRMIQVCYIHCALNFYYYYIVIFDEVTIELTVMQSQWEL